MEYTDYVRLLSSSSLDERLNALKKLKELIDDNKIEREHCEGIANNHIHTTYSFSSYSPSAAVFQAWRSGLESCGIIDHDGVGGCKEFYEAGKIIGIPVTCGLECRVKTDGTGLLGRMINNTDQKSIAYVVMHAIPQGALNEIDEIFKPLREKREIRNRKMCKKLNIYLERFGISIDYDNDVLPLSTYESGGTVTERHICFALVKKLVSMLESSKEIIIFLVEKFKIPVSKSEEKRILEKDPRYYEYDILGVLKKHLVEKFYIDADEECMHISEFVEVSKKYGCISAYAYLGDVIDANDSDKKIQQFEDSYIDILMKELKSLGFDAITYMPSRNTRYQLERVMKYCKRYSFLEINGEDINSPRQKFAYVYDEQMFEHLRNFTDVLIGHEIAVNESISNAFFSDKIKELYPEIKDRIEYYRAITRGDRNGN